VASNIELKNKIFINNGELKITVRGVKCRKRDISMSVMSLD